MNPSTAIVCIGEFLWDMLPAGRQPGGAPYNVAVQLQRLGHPAQLISRVGEDELGAGLVAAMQQQGLDCHLIQRSQTHLTGVVKVNLTSGPRVYKIVEPVAWDYLQYTEEVRAAVAEARMVVYGSLAARSAATRETLYRLLQVARFKVFDVNLRPPHYTRTGIKYLLRQADLVKLSEQELSEIMGWLGQPSDEATALPWLAAHFKLEAVCLTKGAAGATLWYRNELISEAGHPAAAQDSLGTSDAFLATLLTHWGTHSPAECLRAALAARPQGTAPPVHASLSP
ncbi:carbohydrate kinase [Hymenobacter taeanensis]|uniref:Carbohydrate kinase n=1 Tax=Hymenobacter taeanensis TaxID=2735321 RepID=A0A6M6BIU2_9BACT|nr:MULTISPECIES: carbohydrate kinase [Hymenobacter]QJX47932.1 carbohydrate kinase [Hymenobacter taeanensis]UOQ82618.1 carbohydrate kinase [Hymenobacter sp. 5414T-23]